VDADGLRRLARDPEELEDAIAAWAAARRDALLRTASARRALIRTALLARELDGGRALTAVARRPPPRSRLPRLGLRGGVATIRRNRLATPAHAVHAMRQLRARARAALRGHDVAMGGLVLLARDVELVAPRGRGRLVIGPWTWIGSGSAVRAHGGRITLGPKVVLGADVTVNAMLDVAIGEGSLLADDVLVIDFDHRTDRVDVPIRAQGTVSSPVRIGDDVWIGRGATVVRGVDVGTGCVVGAGAVVTRDLPPFSVAVGAPARVVRSRLPAGMDPQEAAARLARGLTLPGDPVG